jgi:hypothetical protein
VGHRLSRPVHDAIDSIVPDLHSRLWPDVVLA